MHGNFSLDYTLCFSPAHPASLFSGLWLPFSLSPIALFCFRGVGQDKVVTLRHLCLKALWSDLLEKGALNTGIPRDKGMKTSGEKKKKGRSGVGDDEERKGGA